jgi:multidrug efflux pump subunit AcrA (membrane-fusion protein)
MRVIAKVNENRVEQIKKEMTCSITIDALRGIELTGEVESVSEYPLPSVSRYTSHIKEYATHVLIDNPPDGIRSGMSAKVSVLSERIDQALQIPLTAIFRKNGKAYCLVSIVGKDDFALRTLDLGPKNLSKVVILKGLQEGEKVLVNPDSFIEQYAHWFNHDVTAG